MCCGFETSALQYFFMYILGAGKNTLTHTLAGSSHETSDEKQVGALCFFIFAVRKISLLFSFSSERVKMTLQLVWH